MMSLGSSKHWPEALEVLTGKTEVTVDAILKYFKPLIKWLEAQI
jgi:hypothetical protein